MIRLILLAIVISALVNCIVTMPIIWYFENVSIGANVLSMIWSVISGIVGVVASVKICDRFFEK